MPRISLNHFKGYPEIPLFLLYFAFSCCRSVTSNFIIYRTCYVLMGYNKSECGLLGTKFVDNNTIYLETLVQPLATKIVMVQTLVEYLIPSILSLFLGPWSDKFGRKPVLLTTLTGYMVAYITIAISTIPNLSPWYFILCSTPIFLFGGHPAFLTVSFCYITDITEEANRGLRMGLCEASLVAGMLFGTLSSSYVFEAGGYFMVYTLCSGFMLLAWCYVFYMIPESITNKEQKGRFYSLLSLSLVKDLIKTASKKRQHYERCMLLTGIFIAFLFALGANGDISVIFFYLRENLHWSLRKFTLYTAGVSLSWIIATVTGVYVLQKLLRINEIVLVACGFACLSSSSVFQGLAIQDWHIYCSAILKSVGGFVSPLIRYFISTLISPEESGKIFSLTLALESVTGVIAAPIFTYIYNLTISSFSGFFNFVVAGIYGTGLLFTLFIFLMRKYPRTKYTVIFSE